MEARSSGDVLVAQACSFPGLWEEGRGRRCVSVISK